ncbi:MAG: D-2-hydroxyacid dehydrogenase [Spirochaetales bacterium]|nr:D-2-hydroxyacid dehydrogenase [Spirochaetales bacterium]
MSSSEVKLISVFITHPVVSCWNFSEDNARYLQDALPETRIVVCKTEEEFLSGLSETEIALVWYFKQEWLKKAPKLMWIITPAAGRDYFSVTPPPGLTIDYCTFHGELMGETVLAMMLAQVRGIRDTIRAQEKERWPRAIVQEHMRPLRGSHLLVCGFGHIGRWVGRLAKPFGMRITGINRTNLNPPQYFEKGDKVLTPADLDRILPETDHLVLALPGGAETANIIDKKRISLLPSHAVIYNVGRGNAIDEAALLSALSKRSIEAAYLDVFGEEPLPEASPLRRSPYIFIMPHASAISPNYLSLFSREVVLKYRKRYR